MDEAFLHFLWKYQYFNRNNLKSTTGSSVSVLYPGSHNHDHGPDFLEAKIRIDNIEWAGNVEIHLRSSDWIKHKHNASPKYQNIILHVVYENDADIEDAGGQLLQTIELKEKFDMLLLEKYHVLKFQTSDISCASQISNVDGIKILSMFEKALINRLERKSDAIKVLLSSCNNDWEQTAYEMLTRNFGFKKNHDGFERLASLLPLKIVQKHAGNLMQIEALLFGVAGFLKGNPVDDYHKLLQKEYHFLEQKYEFLVDSVPESLWNFSRLRPANFPTLRIAQLSSLLNRFNNFFSSFLHLPIENMAEFIDQLQVEPSDYWKNHYIFGKQTEHHQSTLGKGGVENIIINTIAPILASYSTLRDEHWAMEKALILLQQVPYEKNNIIDKWLTLGIKIKTGFDSQAAIELHNEFCLKKRCLECKIGYSLVKSE